MKLVILESPYRGGSADAKAYLNACILDCIKRGESPYASHKMLTDSLDDSVLEARRLGIEAGFEFHKVIKTSVVYLDLRISAGMREGIANALDLGNEVIYRYIGEPFSCILPHEFKHGSAIY